VKEGGNSRWFLPQNMCQNRKTISKKPLSNSNNFNKLQHIPEPDQNHEFLFSQGLAKNKEEKQLTIN